MERAWLPIVAEIWSLTRAVTTAEISVRIHLPPYSTYDNPALIDLFTLYPPDPVITASNEIVPLVVGNDT